MELIPKTITIITTSTTTIIMELVPPTPTTPTELTSDVFTYRFAKRINLAGFNLQPSLPDPDVTLRLTVVTRHRDVIIRGSTGDTVFIHDFGTTRHPPRTSTHRFPAAHLADPALVGPILADALDVANLRRVASQLLAFARDKHPLRVEARVEVFEDREIDAEDEFFAEYVEYVRGLAEAARRAEVGRVKESCGFRGGDGEECAVCLKGLSGELIRTSCGHVFHEGCVLRWLGRKNSCPLCRKILLRLSDD